ncbi:Hypothetical predicted protein [Paramuricea clavata]|uniref:Uncharacterized protein n=1 Tax=Paramuricea clavata TaxID=317549 RepID=A0A6S7FX18_PARCT|nr:Hypothetical predicted protein [Paramuricea clavata]
MPSPRTGIALVPGKMPSVLRNLAIKAVFRLLPIISAYIIYKIYNTDNVAGTPKITRDEVIERQRETFFKQEAGGKIAQVKTDAQVYLHNRFSKWKDSTKTYMIPPIFKPKQSGKSVPDFNPGENGERIIYNHLRELGNMGMFVIHDFVLRGTNKWHSMKCKSKDYSVQKSESNTGECDFFIFHHQLGIILLEVKNYVGVSDSNINDAKSQLKKSRELIMKYANPLPNDATQTQDDIPYKKVIALTSIKKADFNRAAFPNLEDDTLFLFKDNSQDISSFRKWWNEAIENPLSTIQLSAETQAAYERALSSMLIDRHMGPVKETECLGELYESLVKYKYYGNAAYPQLVENMFPFFRFCYWEVLNQKDKKDGSLAKDEEKEKNKPREKSFRQEGMGFLDKLWHKVSKFIQGNKYSLIDDSISTVLKHSFCFPFEDIRRFTIKMLELWSEIGKLPSKDHSLILKRYPYLKLESPEDYNMLNQHLSRSEFMEGDKPSVDDKQVMELLTCRMRLEHAHYPIVMTSEQLVVFEGPSKQLIIGPPGSGKTELLKFKALELDIEMKICKREKKIMYILANGSPDYPDRHSLFFYQMKEFFKISSFVEVISIVLEDESAEDTEHTTSEIRKKIQSGEYEHAFIDEYWIGSKPTEHKIILELVRGLPGYVWISSMFNYQPEAKKVKANTQPLLTALHENGGKVRHITQVMRATNSIIELERDYSKVYADRSYPYGTEQILFNSNQGQPVTWAAEKNVNEMYDKCVDIVSRAITDAVVKDAVKSDKPAFSPADILIADFAIRMNESRQLKQSLLDRLKNSHIPVWTFEERREQFLRCTIMGKVTLLRSDKRSASEFIDGVEWPMVVVILPSGMVLKTAKLADGAEKLRKLDTYISFFRTKERLVVISDKWTNKEEFLSDVKTQV